MAGGGGGGGGPFFFGNQLLLMRWLLFFATDLLKRLCVQMNTYSRNNKEKNSCARSLRRVGQTMIATAGPVARISDQMAKTEDQPCLLLSLSRRPLPSAHSSSSCSQCSQRPSFLVRQEDTICTYTLFVLGDDGKRLGRRLGGICSGCTHATFFIYTTDWQCQQIMPRLRFIYTVWRAAQAPAGEGVLN